MNEQTDNQQWSQYLETVRRASEPVKLDLILQKRLQAFIEARKTKSLPIED